MEIPGTFGAGESAGHDILPVYPAVGRKEGDHL
jgi:hypothetical protein